MRRVGRTHNVVPIEAESYRNQTLVRFQMERVADEDDHWNHVLTVHGFGYNRVQAR
jgi:hypothetical protein